MKIHFNADGSVKTIENREFLVVGSDGINILEVYSDYPFEDISAVNAYASFRRSDKFIIANMKMTPSPVEAPDHFELPLNYSTGILAMAGELEITIKLKGEKKALANGMVCANIKRAIGRPDEASALYHKILILEGQVGTLEEGLTAETYSKSVIDGKLEEKAAVGHEHEEYLKASDIPDVDLSNYNTKEEVNSKISNHNNDEIAHSDIRGLISSLATKVTDVENIITVIDGEDDTPDTVINKLHEIVALLNGYAEGTTLADLLGGKAEAEHTHEDMITTYNAKIAVIEARLIAIENNPDVDIILDEILGV